MIRLMFVQYILSLIQSTAMSTSFIESITDININFLDLWYAYCTVCDLHQYQWEV